MKVGRHLAPLFLTIAALLSIGCGVSVRSPLTTAKRVTIPKTAVVKTADQASRIALMAATSTLSSLDPQVTDVQLMVPDPVGPPSGRYLTANPSDDPANLVWVVDIDQGAHSATPCPAPPPGVDQTICWYPKTATIAVSVMIGNVVAVSAPYPRGRGTPYAPTIGVPPSAAIPTREDAMAAAFKLVPGQDGSPPTILEVRLLSGAEWINWLEQHGRHVDASQIDPSAPIWEMEFVDAALAQGCTSENIAGCVHDHLYLSLDATTGKSLGFLFPATGTPANFTP